MCTDCQSDPDDEGTELQGSGRLVLAETADFVYSRVLVAVALRVAPPHLLHGVLRPMSAANTESERKGESYIDNVASEL